MRFCFFSLRCSIVCNGFPAMADSKFHYIYDANLPDGKPVVTGKSSTLSKSKMHDRAPRKINGVWVAPPLNVLPTNSFGKVVLQTTGQYVGHYKVTTNLGVVSYCMSRPPAVPLPGNNGKWIFHTLCATIEKKV